MTNHIYLSLLPESLIASMLEPEEFGNYFAVGPHKHARGQAIFFEIDPDAAGDAIDWEKVKARCTPHSDGSPRCSTYLRIYRALEMMPVAALSRLYLTTHDGRTLELEPQQTKPESNRSRHLYQEIGPVTPRVVSNLGPLEFCRALTAPDADVSVPRIVFAEMKLAALADDPDAIGVDDLPYPSLQHLRDCLHELDQNPGKTTKTVIREMSPNMLYRTVRGGFYVGDANDFRYFPLPPREELETTYYTWWRSALNFYGS